MAAETEDIVPGDLAALAAQIRACKRCPLHRGRTLAVPGEGPRTAHLLLIGEAPGRDEDRSGRPFCGAAGRILDDALRRAGVTRSRAFVTNAVKCRPPENRRPRRTELRACRPYLIAQIATIRVRAIVALGQTATTDLLGPGKPLARVRGKWQRLGGIPVLPTYHPAAILYNRQLRDALAADLRAAWRRTAKPLPAKILSEPPRRGVRTQRVVSAGGLVFDGKGRVLLLRKADEGIWCFPKGHVERGETLQETAAREIREESGLRCDVGEGAAEIRYAFYWPPEDVNYDKRVVYFLARPVSGRVAPEFRFEEAAWVAPATALRRLYHDNDRDALRRALRVSTATGRRRGSPRTTSRSRRRPS